MAPKRKPNKKQIAAAVAAIRVRAELKNKGDGVPVLTKWKPFLPFVALANPHAGRGHVEVDPGQCKACRELRPPGGWNRACQRGDARIFKGG
jgi:hypothetical protein